MYPFSIQVWIVVSSLGSLQRILPWLFFKMFTEAHIHGFIWDKYLEIELPSCRAASGSWKSTYTHTRVYKCVRLSVSTARQYFPPFPRAACRALGSWGSASQSFQAAVIYTPGQAPCNRVCQSIQLIYFFLWSHVPTSWGKNTEMNLM